MKFYAAVLAALLAFSASAQFRESVEVRVLEIEATVVDKEGNTIDDLGADDFTVTIGGKPAEITSVFLVNRGTTTAAEASSATPKSIQVPLRVIVVVDDIHLHPETKRHALNGIRDYIERTMDAWTMASLVTWNGTVEVRAQPTNDRALLLRELDAIAQEIPRGMGVDAERRSLVRQCEVSPVACRAAAPQFAESQAADTDRTIRALHRILDAASRIDGRKAVFFVSEGMAAVPGAEIFTVTEGARGTHMGALQLNRMRELKQLAKRAQEAGIVLCTIDPSLPIGAANRMDDFNIDRTQIRDNMRMSVQILARETGGQVIADQNDLPAALARLDDRVSTYYSIAVRAPATKGKIEVRVKTRKDLRVLTAKR